MQLGIIEGPCTNGDCGHEAELFVVVDDLLVCVACATRGGKMECAN